MLKYILALLAAYLFATGVVIPSIKRAMIGQCMALIAVVLAFMQLKVFGALFFLAGLLLTAAILTFAEMILKYNWMSRRVEEIQASASKNNESIGGTKLMNKKGEYKPSK